MWIYHYTHQFHTDNIKATFCISGFTSLELSSLLLFTAQIFNLLSVKSSLSAQVNTGTVRHRQKDKPWRLLLFMVKEVKMLRRFRVLRLCEVVLLSPWGLSGDLMSQGFALGQSSALDWWPLGCFSD